MVRADIDGTKNSLPCMSLSAWIAWPDDLRITYSLRSSASVTMMSGPRPMKIWRITGSLARTVGDIGIASSIGTLRQPSTTWPSMRTARSISCSQAMREAFSFGRNTMPTPYSPGGGSSTPCFAISSRKYWSGNLDQDAGAVAHQLVGADRAAVVEVLQDQQALLDDRVALVALDVGDEADAAGIVFVGRDRTNLGQS